MIPASDRICITVTQMTFREMFSHTFIVLMETEDRCILTTSLA